MKEKVWTLEEVEEFFKKKDEAMSSFTPFYNKPEYRERLKSLAQTRSRDERGRFIGETENES